MTKPEMVTVPTVDTRRFLTRRTIAKHALRLDRSSPTVATLLRNEYKLSPLEEDHVRERVADMRTAFKFFVGRLRESNVDVMTLDDRTQLFRSMEQNINAVINVNNPDNCCFEYAILSCLYPSKNNPTRVCSYTKYKNTLNSDNIDFTVPLKQIPRFEKQNSTISINVISLEPESKGYSIDYLSPDRDRKHHVNLLLLSDENTTHYTWIKHFSRLLGDRTKHEHASFVCNSCLNVFSAQRVLDEHIPQCIKNCPNKFSVRTHRNPTNAR